MDYPWNLCQYLAGIQGIYCRSGMASRETGEEFPVAVLVMPKVCLVATARRIMELTPWFTQICHDIV